MSNNNPKQIQLLQDPFLNALRKEHVPVRAIDFRLEEASPV